MLYTERSFRYKLAAAHTPFFFMAGWRQEVKSAHTHIPKEYIAMCDYCNNSKIFKMLYSSTRSIQYECMGCQRRKLKHYSCFELLAIRELYAIQEEDKFEMTFGELIWVGSHQ